MDTGVSLSDYQMSGAAETDASDLAELQKALTAGAITGRDTDGLTTASGAPLKVESLENTLKILSFQESDMVFWSRIPKLPAFNTVEEYNQLQEYGREGFSFNREGELPEEDDTIYVRRSQQVKYFGSTRVISHQMQLVNTMIGNVVQQEIMNGTLKILRDVDEALAFGNADITPENFNGLYKQQQDSFTSLDLFFNSDQVIDLRGKSLREADIERGALTIVENHGEANLFLAPPVVLSNFVKKFHEFKLIQPNTPALTDGVMGQRVNSFMSQFGLLDLGWDKFLKAKVKKTLASGATNPKSATAPTADGTTPKAAVTDTNTKFGLADGPDADGAGDYRYAVSALNRFGESGLTNLSTGGSPDAKVTVAVTEAVDLKFTDGGGPNPATGYRIYRSRKDTAPATAAADEFFPIFEISVAQLAAGFDGGAAGLVRDLSRFLIDAEDSFLIQNSDQVWSFKQLAPLMKMDLAQIGPATRFMILLYGTPQLYAPKKMTRYINVGKDLT